MTARRLAALLLLASALQPSCAFEVEGLRVEVVAEVGDASGAVTLDDASVHVHAVELIRCPAPMALLSRARADHGVAVVGGDVPAGAPSSLGVLRPSPDAYCEARVTLDPADDGWTLRAEGRDDVGVIEIRSFGSAVVDLPLERPLTLDEAHRLAVLTVRLDLAAAIASVERRGVPEDVGLDVIRALPSHASARAALSAP